MPPLQLSAACPAEVGPPRLLLGHAGVAVQPKVSMHIQATLLFQLKELKSLFASMSSGCVLCKKLSAFALVLSNQEFIKTAAVEHGLK